MTDTEQRFVRALARYQLAEHAYTRMNGVYVYAVADERTTARVEMLAAAQEVVDG